MATKRSKEEIAEARRQLDEEEASMTVEEDDDGDEIIVIHGRKGIAKLLKHLGIEEEEEEESEEKPDENSEEESEEEEEEPDIPVKKTRTVKTAKPTGKPDSDDSIPADVKPKSRARWFSEPKEK